jgi:hypothetical protein
MSVKSAAEPRNLAAAGLSPETRKLWLAAIHYRRVADLAATKVTP